MECSKLLKEPSSCPFGFMLIFPALELLEGRLKPWAKKSCRKGREAASSHLGSQGCKLHLQQGKRVVLAGLPRGRGAVLLCLSRAPSLESKCVTEE